MQTRRAGWLATAVLTVGAATACGSQGPAVAGAGEAGDETPAPGGSAVAAKSSSLQDLQTTTAAARARTSQSKEDPQDSRQTAIVRAANRVSPAVVNVSVISRERAEPTSLWESFFMPPDAQRRAAGFGSGVLIRSDGIIVTNNHVVQNAERIRVTLPDGRDFDGELVGTDPVADIAVLRIHGDSLPVAPLGTSKGILIGEWAVAIGNPFANYFSDAEPTVTAGVISAVDRNIVPSSNDDGFYLGMIQTDASINPGNSGGPLVDALGQVIGINASIFTRSGGSEGMGFAIPIDRALRVADDLVNHGEVRRAWTGIDVAAVEADAWGRTRGVRVSRVAPDSPGEKAGVAVGDRLLRANGHALTNPLDFEAVLLDLRAGDSIELTIDGRSRPLHVTAAALPSVTAARVTVLQDMQLITVTPQIRAERGIQSKQGALIASISDSLSSQLGLQEGDVLVQVNRTPVTSAEDAKRIFESLKGQGNIRLWVERNGGYLARDLYWRR
ncbi:MAG: trypsin-like peptidase domain-containing protein [Gemmatimonadetes bacterium]|nr:trypsin-like peptidase domain-containing protein [Gemmatimonadota bacterium]